MILNIYMCLRVCVCVFYISPPPPPDILPPSPPPEPRYHSLSLQIFHPPPSHSYHCFALQSEEAPIDILSTHTHTSQLCPPVRGGPARLPPLCPDGCPRRADLCLRPHHQRGWVLMDGGMHACMHACINTHPHMYHYVYLYYISTHIHKSASHLHPSPTTHTKPAHQSWTPSPTPAKRGSASPGRCTKPACPPTPCPPGWQQRGRGRRRPCSCPRPSFSSRITPSTMPIARWGVG